MKNGPRPWIAGQPEKRAALVIASLSLILVAVAFAWPLIGNEPTAPAAVETARQAVPEQKAEPAKRQTAPSLPAKQSGPVTPAAPAEKPADKTAVPAAASEQVVKSQAPQKEALGKGFYIQLGAFKDEQRATALAKRLGKSWHTHVVDRPNRLHAVWVGPYNSSALANQDKARISKAEKINGFITRH